MSDMTVIVTSLAWLKERRLEVVGFHEFSNISGTVRKIESSPFFKYFLPET